MRLINTKILEMEDFPHGRIPAYAILSHTWADDELSFEDMQKKVKRIGEGWTKIYSACRQAIKDKLNYLWADTCCIDKRSSTELQEAINSMYRFYSDATVCYVYMADLRKECPNLEAEDDEESPLISSWKRRFELCKWFFRGWTLQELIAPKEATFYGSQWNFVGRKSKLAQTLSTITGIDASILLHKRSLSTISVAQRMSWAAHRQTSRTEDQAYSLLGIFNVNLPMLYGEGPKAFTRLQEEILKTSTDHSIFAWELSPHSQTQGLLLATTPSNFACCQRVVRWGKPGAFEMTNRGLRMTVPVLEHSDEYGECLAILNCRFANDLSGTLALRLKRYGGSDEYYTSSTSRSEQSESLTMWVQSRLSFVPAASVIGLASTTVHITREFEPEASKIKFWVPRPNLQSPPFHITRTFPEDSWDVADGIMHAGDDIVVRGGALIQTASGNQFVIAFGFDIVSADDAPTEESFFIPCVSGSSRMNANHKRLADYKRLADFVQRSFPTCQHKHNSCLRGKCLQRSQFVTLWPSPETEKLEVRISMSTIMNETVFVVNLQLTEVFQLEAGESLSQLDAPMEGTGATTGATTYEPVPKEQGGRMSIFDWHKNTYANDRSSVAAQLSQLNLSRLETILHENIGSCVSDVPLQIWMRISGSLHLMTKHPQDVHTLPGNMLYWDVQKGNAAKGTVVIRSEQNSEVIVVFMQKASRQLTLQAWENEFARATIRPTGVPQPPVWSSLRVQREAQAPSGSTTVQLVEEAAVIRARIRRAEIPEKLSFIIDVRFEKDNLKDLNPLDPEALDLRNQIYPPLTETALLPYFSGDRNWNAGGYAHSTFTDTNVLNDPDQ